MGRTEIYIVRKRRKRWELYKQIPQATRGAFYFWIWLEEKYLPPFRYHDELRPVSRLSYLLDGSKAQEIWDLWKDSRLSSDERLVLFSTFDYNYLPFERIPDMVEAMRAVHLLMEEGSNFGKQADALECLFKERKDVQAVAFNGTSVTSHTDVIGETFDKDNMSDIWESFLEAKQIVGQ